MGLLNNNDVTDDNAMTDTPFKEGGRGGAAAAAAGKEQRAKKACNAYGLSPS